MKISKITIENYRSILKEGFLVKDLKDKSLTYGFLGINEAGKSNFLNAISLIKQDSKISSHDFYKNNVEKNEIFLNFEYVLENEDIVKIFELISKVGYLDEYIKEKEVILKKIDKEDGVEKEVKEINQNSRLLFLNKNKNLFSKIIIKKTFEKNNLSGIYKYNFPQLDSEFNDKVFENIELCNSILENILHRIRFWTFEEKYLLSNNMSTQDFINNVNSILPLKNCFNLSGISDEEIPEKINTANSDSSEKVALIDLLNNKITDHIKNIWKDHKISIEFTIDRDHINFHIKEDSTKEKVEKVYQRSDGFKQYLSFILSISSEDRFGSLKNSIILIDEPETHFHPKAQILFLEELIKITKTNNNICIFSTHSNYMIDKSVLDRNYIIIKELLNKGEDGKNTKIKDIYNDIDLISYSYFNYHAFEIPTSDYFDQLYSHIEENYESYFKENINKHHELSNVDSDNINSNKVIHKTKKEMEDCNYCFEYKNTKTNTTEYISLLKYVRHKIHHQNNNFSNSKLKNKNWDELLKECIDKMEIIIKDQNNIK